MWEGVDEIREACAGGVCPKHIGASLHYILHPPTHPHPPSLLQQQQQQPQKDIVLVAGLAANEFAPVVITKPFLLRAPGSTPKGQVPSKEEPPVGALVCIHVCVCDEWVEEKEREGKVWSWLCVVLSSPFSYCIHNSLQNHTHSPQPLPPPTWCCPTPCPAWRRPSCSTRTRAWSCRGWWHPIVLSSTSR